MILSFALSFRNTCLSGTALSLKNLRVRLGNQRCPSKGCILMRLKKKKKKCHSVVNRSVNAQARAEVPASLKCAGKDLVLTADKAAG